MLDIKIQATKVTTPFTPFLFIFFDRLRLKLSVSYTRRATRKPKLLIFYLISIMTWFNLHLSCMLIGVIY